MLEAVLPGRHIKSFVRALKCLSRIGPELGIEQCKDSLVFRTLGTAQVSYACIRMQQSFFSAFRSVEPRVRCKINMENFVNSMRSLGAVQNIILCLDGDCKCVDFVVC
jgi:hypothetical protein